MAKIYKLHIYSTETDHNIVMQVQKSPIQIYHEYGDEKSKQLESIFEEYNISIVQQVEPPGDKGGGGDFNVFPLTTWLFVGLVVYVIVPIGKSFFGELGKGLAKKVLAVLFKNDKVSQLTISRGSKEIKIIIPEKTDDGHLQILSNLLKNIKAGNYIYIKELGKLVKSYIQFTSATFVDKF